MHFWRSVRFADVVTKSCDCFVNARDGAISDSRFGRRMRGTGPYAEHIAALFAVATRKYGLDRPFPALSAVPALCEMPVDMLSSHTATYFCWLLS